MDRKANLGLVVVVLVCFGGLAGEQALGVVPFPFYDGFENIDVGDYPDENGWQVMFSGVSASASDDVAHTGNKSFYLDGTTWGRHDYVSVGPPEWVSDNMTYEVSFYIPVGNNAVVRVGFGNPEYGDYTSFRNSFFVGSPGGLNEITFGTYYKNRPPGDPLISVGTYTPGTWATLRADLYFGSLQADLWLNGVLKVSGAPIKPKEWTHPEFGYDVHDKWVIACGDGDMYFDDVALTVLVLTVLSIEITGPNEVAEDSQVQYKAIAHFDNNSTQDVTDSAQWSVDPNSNCSIDTGLLTTELIDLPEDVTITAQYSEGGVNEVAEKQVSIFAICPSGSALDFDGDGDYVNVDSSFGLTTHTTSFWMQPNILAYGIAVEAVRGTSRKFGYIGLRNDGTVTHHVRSGTLSSTDKIEAYTDSSVEIGKWYHVVSIMGAEGPEGNKIYVNGVKQTLIYLNGSASSTESWAVIDNGNGPDKLNIGSLVYDGVGNEFFDGIIDDVRIYDRALSAEEIRTLMHSRPEADEPNLVAYWDFDEGEGQVAADLAGGNHGQLGDVNTPDSSDPNWTDSIPLVGDICNLEEIIEKNLLNVSGMKNDVLDILDEAIGKEEALWEYMDTVFKDRDFGNISKGDVVKAKQKIHSAIQHEEQAETTVERSIEKLDDALNALGIEQNVE